MEDIPHVEINTPTRLAKRSISSMLSPRKHFKSKRDKSPTDKVKRGNSTPSKLHKRRKSYAPQSEGRDIHLSTGDAYRRVSSQAGEYLNRELADSIENCSDDDGSFVCIRATGVNSLPT